MPEAHINTGFRHFNPLLKLLGGEIYLAVSWYTFVCFILHIHLILHFCVPRLKFLEPKWSHANSIIRNDIYFYNIAQSYSLTHCNFLFHM